MTNNPKVRSAPATWVASPRRTNSPALSSTRWRASTKSSGLLQRITRTTSSRVQHNHKPRRRRTTTLEKRRKRSHFFYMKCLGYLIDKNCLFLEERRVAEQAEERRRHERATNSVRIAWQRRNIPLYYFLKQNSLLLHAVLHAVPHARKCQSVTNLSSEWHRFHESGCRSIDSA